MAETEEGWYVVRKLEEREVPFVAKSWLRSYLAGHYTARARRDPYLTMYHKRLGAELTYGYFLEHNPVVNELLARGVTVVAELLERPEGGQVDDERPKILLGFACAERVPDHDVTALHYVYVKTGYRLRGVARAMTEQLLAELGSNDVVRSHATPMSRRITAANQWPYVPYTAFVRKEKKRCA